MGAFRGPDPERSRQGHRRRHGLGRGERRVETYLRSRPEIHRSLIAFRPDSRRLADGGDGGRDHDLGPGRPGGRSSLRRGQAVNPVYSPDGRRLACLDDSAESEREPEDFRGRDPETGRVVRSLDRSELWIRKRVCPSGRRSAPMVGCWRAAYEDGTFRFWDAATGRRLRTIQGYERSRQPRLLPSRRPPHRLVGRRGEEVKIWDIMSGQLLLTLPSRRGDSPEHLRFSDDGHRLISSGPP